MSFGVLYRVKKGIRLGRVWQNRFWDHIIRDQNDLNRHIDYIHYNPVKHGCISKPKDWPHSSFRHYVKAGVYQDDWGAVPIVGMDNDFGE